MGISDLPRWVQIDDGVTLVDIPFVEALGYTQTYEKFGGRVTHRTLDGTGVKQQNWVKLKTTLSGNGAYPLGFAGLDFSGPLTVKCGAPRKVSSASNVIVIPADRRADAPYLPYATKTVNGIALPAGVSLGGNTATVTPDASASGYSVLYFPQITALADDPSESYDAIDDSSSWSITAEEV